MNAPTPSFTPVRDPLAALLAGPGDAVLALITGVEGPSYRPVGAAMALFADGDRAGTLSSGCIESDIAIHAAQARVSGAPVSVRYGRGSPFIDIQLPCGGGLDILLLPAPDLTVLGEVITRKAARRPCTLEIDTASGAMRVTDTGATGHEGTVFRIRHDPDVQFVVFGKGPESSTFAGLVQSAGYPNLLLSPDPETRDAAAAAGCRTRDLPLQQMPTDLQIDPWTAIVLFFHDHDWEPPILAGALDTPAFYIGAQGSQRARDARLLAMEAMGVDPAQFSRLHGPVGLIRSARDAGTLAVSVLAEVLDVAMQRVD